MLFFEKDRTMDKSTIADSYIIKNMGTITEPQASGAEQGCERTL
jgi:hypothetical protein